MTDFEGGGRNAAKLNTAIKAAEMQGERGGQPSRRQFIEGAAAMGAAAVMVGGFLDVSAVAAAQLDDPTFSYARPKWELEAIRVEQTFGDGVSLPFFRFKPLGATGLNGALPVLVGHEDRTATLTITNTLNRAIQPTFVGLFDGPEIRPGQTRRMRLRMPPAGTWLLTDALLGPAAGPVGLGAVVISKPRPNGEPSPHDCEYVLLFQDTDDRWNLDVDAGVEPDTSVYEANYHTVNGLSFPDLATDPDSRVVCAVGDQVLIRFGNLGHVRQAVHFHGYHVEILARNNVAETMLGMKDTIPLPGYSTAEVVMPVTQPGIFPLHPHSLMTVTDNGLYPGGQLLLIEAF